MKKLLGLVLIIIITSSLTCCKKDIVNPTTHESPTKEELHLSTHIMSDTANQYRITDENYSKIA